LDLQNTDVAILDSPEGWYLGAKHPQATFCSLGILPSSLDLSSSSWGSPPNVDGHLWPGCPLLSHPTNTFDVVLIHPLFHVLRCTDWPALLKEALRVLIPGGTLTISIMDPVPKNAGPLLEDWTTKHLVLGLARKFMVSRPSLLLPCWIEEFAAFPEPVVETMEFPIYSGFAVGGAGCEESKFRNRQTKVSKRHSLPSIDEDPGAQAREEVQTLGLLAYKHLYQSLYEDFAPLLDSSPLGYHSNPAPSRSWWWDDPAILDECRRFDTAFEAITYVCRKDQTWQN